jgi:hypothetical protein
MPKERYILLSNCPDINSAMLFINNKSKEFEKKYKKLPNFDFFIAFSDSKTQDLDYKRVKKQCIDVVAYISSDSDSNISNEIDFFSPKNA